MGNIIRAIQFRWIVAFAIVVVVGFAMFRTAQSVVNNIAMQHKIEGVFVSLKPYPQSQEISKGQQVAPQSTLSHCLVVTYSGTYLVDAPIKDIREFYAKEFLELGWKNGVVDQTTHIDVYSIPPITAGVVLPNGSGSNSTDAPTVYVVSVGTRVNNKC